MGFDLYGRAPKSERGKYFRNAISGWGPLADYVLARVRIPVSEQEAWYSNDGQRVSAETALKLADALDALVASGDAGRYAVEPPYEFDEENVRQFALFCRESGGFRIW